MCINEIVQDDRRKCTVSGCMGFYWTDHRPFFNMLKKVRIYAHPGDYRFMCEVCKPLPTRVSYQGDRVRDLHLIDTLGNVGTRIREAITDLKTCTYK